MKEPFPLQERIRLAKAGPLHEKFPVKFDSGMTWLKLNGFCAQCNREIPDDCMCGEVIPTFRDVYSIRGIGLCRNCALVTCFTYILKPTGAHGYNSGGEWVFWPATRKTWMSRLIKRLKQLFA